jgi:sugar lactone lactonase YvrE
MTLDISRFTFDPANDYFGVVKEQGRPQPDSDWNEWLSESSRRVQASSLDTLGTAVVPVQTPNAFLLQTYDTTLSIGAGRMYVDGLLAENHGLPVSQGGSLAWDPILSEQRGQSSLLFNQQPYLPGAAFPPTPPLAPGNYLAYLDVFNRPVNYLQRPDLVEEAVGTDTTGRIQTAWQVKLLPVSMNVNSATALEAIPQWQTLTQPSAGRLSTVAFAPAASDYPIDSAWSANAVVPGITAFGEIAIDNNNGFLYVSSGTAVQKFDLYSGVFLGTLSFNDGAGHAVTLYQIGSLFLDTQGFLYMGERGPSVTGVYKADLSTGKAVLLPPGAGVPTGLFVDAAQNVYVSEDTSNHIYLYQFSGGTYTGGQITLPASPSLGQPTGLFKSGNTLFVADSFNGQLIAYTQGVSALTYVSGGLVLGPSQLLNPQQIVMDALGNVYISSLNDGSVVVASPTGEVLKFQPSGIGNQPGIGIDLQGNIYLGGSAGHLTKLVNAYQGYTGGQNQFYRVEIHPNSESLSFDSQVSWGPPGTGQGQFEAPSGIGVDSFGMVYVSDSQNDDVMEFDSNGIFLHQWGNSSQFSNVSGLFVDQTGKVYTVESTGDRAQVFDANGNNLLTFNGSSTTPASPAFNGPTGIAADPSGNIYVADTVNGRVAIYNPAGAYQSQIKTANSLDFSNPSGVAVDPTGQYLYVADTGNNRILKFTVGGILQAWTPGTGAGPFSGPKAVAVDGLGNVYIADTGNHRVQVVSSTGTFLTQITDFETEAGVPANLASPAALSTDLRGNVYVVDSSLKLVIKFSSWNWTFKWSRDNGSVATPVLGIQSDTVHNVVNLKVGPLAEGSAAPFSPGDWVELMDDFHELNGLPGEFHQIQPLGVDPSGPSLVLNLALKDMSFQTNFASSHLRVRRWDQNGKVYLADGQTVWYDLDNPTTMMNSNPPNGVIPVPNDQTVLLLENGVRISFSLDSTVPNGSFHNGDYWNFTARTVDGSVEPLNAAPPRGVFHHYAELAILNVSSSHPLVINDARNVQTPSQCCTICVTPQMHNGGTLTIPMAIKWVDANGGGTVCLTQGTYLISPVLAINVQNPLILRGAGDGTILQSCQQVIQVNPSPGRIEIRDLQVLSLEPSPPASQYSSVVVAQNAGPLSIVRATANSQSQALLINGQDVTVEGFNVLQSFQEYAITVSASQGVRLVDTSIQGVQGDALLISGSNNVTVRGLQVESTAGATGAVRIQDSIQLLVEDAYIPDCNSGDEPAFTMVDSQDVVFKGINVGQASLGIDIENCQDVAVRDFTGTALGTTGIYVTSSQGVALEGSNVGRCPTALEVQDISSDIVVRGFRAECTGNVPMLFTNSKGIRLEGLDIDLMQNGGIAVNTCAGITLKGSSIRSLYSATAFLVIGSTGVVVSGTDMEVPGSAVGVVQSSDVSLENLQIVSAGYGVGGVVNLGPMCANVRLSQSSIVANPALMSGSNGNVIAVNLTGWLAGLEIQGNAIQAPIGISTSGGTYLSTLGFWIGDNLLNCTINGVYFQGYCFHSGLTRISGNTLAGNAQGAITMTGSTVPGTAVEIDSNQINATGSGAAILVGTEARITGNQISGVGSPGNTSQGIVLGKGLDPVIGHCSVTDNQVLQVNQEGLLVETALNHGVIARNIIDTAFGGIVFRNEGSADSIQVEDNSLLNIQCPTTGEPASAVGILNAASARVAGNTVNGVNCGTGTPPWGAGLLAVACRDLHVSDNEVVGVTGGTNLAGMGIFGPFDRVNTDDNEARPSNNPVSNTSTVLSASPAGTALWVQTPPAPVVNGYGISFGWASVTGTNTGIAVDSFHGIVYASTGTAILKFNLSTGAPMGPLSMSSSGVPLIFPPIGPLYQERLGPICLDPQGFLYLGDRVGPAVWKVNTTTGAAVQLPQGSAGIPNGLFADASQNVYVSQYGSAQVYLYTYSGGTYANPVLVTLPGSPALVQPSGLYKVGTTLYVADSTSNYVIAYTPGSDGTYGTGMGTALLAGAVSNPQQIVVDFLGNVIVASPGNNSFVALTPKGTVVTNSFFGATFGIGADASGNLYVGNSVGSALVVKVSPAFQPGMISLSADTFVLNMDGANILTRNGIGLTWTSWGTGRIESVRAMGNRLEASSTAGAVAIATRGQCQLVRNYCALPVTATGPAVVAQVTAAEVVVKANRVRGGTASINIATAANPANAVVIGNMTTQGVQVNGGPVPAAWAPLNITG